MLKNLRIRNLKSFLKKLPGEEIQSIKGRHNENLKRLERVQNTSVERNEHFKRLNIRIKVEIFDIKLSEINP